MAVAAFLTAGYPQPAGFGDLLASVAAEADIVEVGVPFSDPMADGVTIQRSSHRAISHGVRLDWILDVLGNHPLSAPPVLMGYLNPFLAFGIDLLAARAADVGVAGFIIPDLPLEESNSVRDALDHSGIALIQLVSPVTPPARLQRIAESSGGFVYAVTVAGTTGATRVTDGTDLTSYLDRVRSVATCPVLAGFGIRTPEQVRALAGHADGVIVGSALIEALDRGDHPADLVASLRHATP